MLFHETWCPRLDQTCAQFDKSLNWENYLGFDWSLAPWGKTNMKDTFKV